MATELTCNLAASVVTASGNEFGAYLSVSNVDKRFGDVRVLRGVELKARPGGFIAIVGRSGSGKSTLLRLIAGLDTPTSGSISIDGAEVRGIDPSVRLMFQEARLLPWRRVRDNVALGLDRRDRTRADQALNSVGLPDRGGDWPYVLSGGQRQRVALARALASSPRLLLLDEPLGPLDALTRLQMQDLVETLWRERGFTTILVTHDVEEAVALADRVVLIEEGTITVNLAIDLPRPRDRSTARFVNQVFEIRERVMGR